MTYYDEAIKTKNTCTRLINDLKHQISNEHRDKTGLRWIFSKCGDRSMWFYTDCYYGYYGSSSVSSNNSNELGLELAETLSLLKSQIIQKTIERLEHKIKEAIKKAQEEAKTILNELGE